LRAAAEGGEWDGGGASVKRACFFRSSLSLVIFSTSPLVGAPRNCQGKSELRDERRRGGRVRRDAHLLDEVQSVRGLFGFLIERNKHLRGGRNGLGEEPTGGASRRIIKEARGS
jgi:hypothetical protein